jgi:hypothetical protein
VVCPARSSLETKTESYPHRSFERGKRVRCGKTRPVGLGRAGMTIEDPGKKPFWECSYLVLLGVTMKRAVLTFMMVIFLAVAGCSGERAEDLFETAKLEELQHNREHATQLYREILTKYPDSEFAAKAQARLSELEKGK